MLRIFFLNLLQTLKPPKSRMQKLPDKAGTQREGGSRTGSESVSIIKQVNCDLWGN